MRRISAPTIKIGQSGIVNPFDLIGSRDLAYEILSCLTKKDFEELIPKEHKETEQRAFPSHVLSPEAYGVLANSLGNSFATECSEKSFEEKKSWLKNGKENIIQKLHRVSDWEKRFLRW